MSRYFTPTKIQNSAVRFCCLPLRLIFSWPPQSFKANRVRCGRSCAGTEHSRLYLKWQFCPSAYCEAWRGFIWCGDFANLTYYCGIRLYDSFWLYNGAVAPLTSSDQGITIIGKLIIIAMVVFGVHLLASYVLISAEHGSWWIDWNELFFDLSKFRLPLL